MRSSRWRRARLALGLAAIASATGCGFDTYAEGVQLTAYVGYSVQLSGDVPVTGEDTTYQWRVQQVPDGSNLELPLEGPSSVNIVVDQPGRYVIDRWVVVGASDSWLNRYYIDGFPSPPVAALRGPTSVSVGQTVAIDGSQSSDPQHWLLTYDWRLIERPPGSVSQLSDATSPTVRLSPDTAGTYEVELYVFDGQLQSTQPATLQIQAQ